MWNGPLRQSGGRSGLAVTVVDVSAGMLEYVAHRAKADGLPEIATQHAGFLTMDFPACRFDAVVSGAALHHLPDAWKLVALRNIARVLKPGGQLILYDVVFSLRKAMLRRVVSRGSPPPMPGCAPRRPGTSPGNSAPLTGLWKDCSREPDSISSRRTGAAKTSLSSTAARFEPTGAVDLNGPLRAQHRPSGR